MMEEFLKLKNEEVKAWRHLLKRSGILTDLTRGRNVHYGTSTGSTYLGLYGMSPKGALGIGCYRLFSTSSPLKQHDNKNNDNKDEDDKDSGNLHRLFGFIALFSLLPAIFTLMGMGEQPDQSDRGPVTITWAEFVNDLLLKGEVEQAVVVQLSNNEVRIIVKVHQGYKGHKGVQHITLNMPDANQFEEKLRKIEDSIGIKSGQGIPVEYKRLGVGPRLVFYGLIGLLIYSFLRRVKLPTASDMFKPYTQANYKRADVLATGKMGTSFKDVAGLHEAKIEIVEFVDYLKNPQRFKALGAKLPKGALLTGPPGCGKTLLAKALATEAQVPFLVMAGSEFVEVIGGLGASRVRNLFQDARSKAPCIIYVDEIDAIGKQRNGNNVGGGSADEEQTLNQLLVELDGMGTVDGVLMLASTNRAEVLDQALLRPGRFDRHINIDFPTLAERKEIYEMYLKKLKLAQPVTDYSMRLSQLSPGMSGADINNICNEAALFAARNNQKVVESSDFEYAVERVTAGAAKKSRVLSVKEKKVIAYHEAGHALVGWLLQYTDVLLRVSIVQRTNATLGFAQYAPTDKHLHSKDELFEKMCMVLGGRVAESLIFNNVTSGAQDDLKKVTQMAYLQIRNLGMSDVIGNLSFPEEGEGEFLKKPYSKRLSRLIDQEATSLVARAYKATEKVLQENKEKLRVVAEALLEKEVLSYNEVEQLIGPPPYGKQSQLNDWTPSPMVEHP